MPHLLSEENKRNHVVDSEVNSSIVLCIVIAPVKRRNQEKTSLFEKDPLTSRQYTGAHLRNFDGRNYGIQIQIITTSILFTGFYLQ